MAERTAAPARFADAAAQKAKRRRSAGSLQEGEVRQPSSAALQASEIRHEVEGIQPCGRQRA